MSLKIHQLTPGQVQLSENNEELHTILNNSTVVCIHDNKLNIIGICHFLFPNEAKAANANKKNPSNGPFHYGDFAIPTLLGLFKKKGSDRNNLEVSILGSSSISSHDLENKIASENIICAEEWIARFNLKLKQKKTGLPPGMLVKMVPASGGVFLKHLSKGETVDSNSTAINTPKPSTTLSSSTVTNNTSMTPSAPNLRTPVLKERTNPTVLPLKSVNSPPSVPLKSNLTSKPVQLKDANNTTPASSNLNVSSNHLPKENVKTNKTNGKIKVLIVDDSKTIRTLLSSIIETSANMEVVGQAADAFEAESLRLRLNPDVITLDIHMPDKDGVTYLEEILSKEPVPVVMVSDLSLKEASPVMKALEIGAFDYFQKPAASELATQGPELITTIKTAYENKDKIKARYSERRKNQNILTSKKNLPPSTIKVDSSVRLIAIGASTGGPDAIRTVLSEFPEKCAPTVIVQHMPPKFTKTFAESLNLTSRVKVKEAENGDLLEDSTVYIAPGGLQMAIEEKNGRLYVSLKDDPPVNRFKPSVDYTFNTIEKIDLKGNLRAAILTGMGADGAYGLLGLKRKGNFTIAQDESTCVVYGMPRAAVEFKAVDSILPLNLIADSLLSQKKKAGSQSA